MSNEVELKAIEDARLRWAQRLALLALVVCALGFAYFAGKSAGLSEAQRLMIDSLAQQFQSSVVPNFTGLRK